LSPCQLRRRHRAKPSGAAAHASRLHHGRAGGIRAPRASTDSATVNRTTREPAGRRVSPQQFRAEFGGDNPPDWQVHTSFRPSLQDAAERAVAAGLDRLRRPDLEAALVAIDPSTGDILAMVGGSNYARTTFNRASRSRRQPGSAFKPFVYAAALEKGFSPVSVLSNLTHVTAPNNPEWNPRSAEGEQPDQSEAERVEEGGHGDRGAGTGARATPRVSAPPSDPRGSMRPKAPDLQLQVPAESPPSNGAASRRHAQPSVATSVFRPPQVRS
jgi:hypothetical protein